MDAEKRAAWRLPLGAAVVLVVAALCVTVVIGVMRSSAGQADEIAVEPSSLDAPGIEPAQVYVHVAGAVRHPGLYRLAAGARVVDAVAAAGGFTRTAEHAGVNLARPISDGEQLHVPRRGETPQVTPVDGTGALESPGAPGLVNLNTADAATLETLPRIGPAIAARILEWREQNGRFTSVDDLLAVPGIGDKMLQNLRPKVTV